MTPVLSRLSRYWRLEALNMILLPGTTTVIVLSLGGKLSAGLLSAMATNVFILGVGALYWRSCAMRREHSHANFDRWIGCLTVAKPIAVILITLSLIVLFIESQNLDPVTCTATWILWGIAALEYINYYVVQLQHFDNMRDINRLLTGRGFRRAHLARDIRRIRARAQSQPEVDDGCEGDG